LKDVLRQKAAKRPLGHKVEQPYSEFIHGTKQNLFFDRKIKAQQCYSSIAVNRDQINQ